MPWIKEIACVEKISWSCEISWYKWDPEKDELSSGLGELNLNEKKRGEKKPNLEPVRTQKDVEKLLSSVLLTIYFITFIEHKFSLIIINDATRDVYFFVQYGVMVYALELGWLQIWAYSVIFPYMLEL